ncbi:ATP-binding cassette domain-containing protein [Bacillus marasmi]|uniref:ATP-binding cassette domain-containing protein n=1 Tax=Bacillus marasmi TaxID=1926279 RepID=UPI0011C80E82|nr:ABC transporter ATP-binding protein [Bacillus marasmi]
MRNDIELNNLSLTYKHFEALKNISFKLDGGKIYGLIGRNGAGKTSLLSLLASFREPTSGSIKIAGKTPFENPDIMQIVSFIYEKDYKEETEKVKGMLEVSERYRPNYDAEYAHHLIQRFKLPLDKPVAELSKGMKSALDVTIGLASRSPITIFDEAYIGMDAPTREIFYQELLEDQGNHPRTIIMSTHLVSEMEYLFDEVIMIDKGKLVLHEDYDSVVSKGASITGSLDAVDAFVAGMEKLSEQRLGNTKAVMVYGEISNQQRLNAELQGLEVGTLTLQDLFIHLTKEDDA